MLINGGNKDQRAQGDVLMQRIKELPEGCKEVKRRQGRIVLQEGEATGHAHRIVDVDAMFYEKDGKFYLVAKQAVTVEHEEHHSQVLEPGIWEIGRIREKDWLSGMVAPVVD